MKSLSILITLVLFCGCTRSRFPVLDTVIGGMSVTKVDGYFDLSDEQKANFENDVRSDLESLRKERFEKIAQVLREIDRRAQGKEDERVLSDAYTMLQKEYKLSSAYMKKSAEKIASQLHKEQIQHFQEKVAKEVAEDRAESVTDKDKDLARRYRKVLNFFSGGLTPKQSDSIAFFTKATPFPWKEKIDNREKLLKKFLQLQAEPDQRAKFAGQFMADYDSLCSEEYSVAMANYESAFKDFLNKFWTTMSSDQKTQLHLRLEDHAGELERLARAL